MSVQKVSRRNMLKTGVAAAALCTVSSVAVAAAASDGESETILRAGIITDMHKTSKEDSDTRKYSTSLPKMREFIKQMNQARPAFIIELGDFVDTLSPETDPALNLSEIESVFKSFTGPSFHVLGNHDFDNLKRDFVLKNMPNTGIPQGQTWYSWDADGVHCIVLDADYTPNTYRPYDMNTPEDNFWTWIDTCIPPQEMEWLANDLRDAVLPVIVFTHQTLDRIDTQDHNIKNASAVRELLEESGKVLAVISGHDHQGGYSNIKGIHYVVLNGNVGVNDSRSWEATSEANGLDLVRDNQFAFLTVRRLEGSRYALDFAAYGRQPGYTLERTL